MTKDSGFGSTRWTVRRWSEQQALSVSAVLDVKNPDRQHFESLNVMPYSVTHVDGNLVTNAGWTRLMNLLTNQGATQAMDATHTRIGVGDSNTAAAYTDTALNAATNKLYKLVTGAGSLGTRTLTFAATFGSSEGNWAWNEFGLDIGATADSTTVAACFFNHKAGIAQGTKTAGQVWNASAVITWT